MENSNLNTPLVVVFYLDRELMSNQEIMTHFSSSVDEMIKVKKLNMVAFFLPTDDVEKIECINPVQLEPADMEKVYGILDDLKSNFDIK
jgi:hypothetical protein